MRGEPRPLAAERRTGARIDRTRRRRAGVQPFRTGGRRGAARPPRRQNVGWPKAGRTGPGAAWAPGGGSPSAASAVGGPVSSRSSRGEATSDSSTSRRRSQCARIPRRAGSVARWRRERWITARSSRRREIGAMARASGGRRSHGPGLARPSGRRRASRAARPPSRCGTMVAPPPTPREESRCPPSTPPSSAPSSPPSRSSRTAARSSSSTDPGDAGAAARHRGGRRLLPRVECEPRRRLRHERPQRRDRRGGAPGGGRPPGSRLPGRGEVRPEHDLADVRPLALDRPRPAAGRRGRHQPARPRGQPRPLDRRRGRRRGDDPRDRGGSATCTLDLASLDAALSERTRLVAVGYASNAVGTINPVAEIVRRAHAVGAWTFVDAVHYAPHGPLDVVALGRRLPGLLGLQVLRAARRDPVGSRRDPGGAARLQGPPGRGPLGDGHPEPRRDRRDAGGRRVPRRGR